MTSPEPPNTRTRVPGPPRTRVQRAIPAPFARPCISIGAPDAQRREWRTVPVQELREGDVIPDVGQVRHIVQEVRVPGLGQVSDQAQAAASVDWLFLVWAGDDQHPTVYRRGDPVWAFTGPAPAPPPG